MLNSRGTGNLGTVFFVAVVLAIGGVVWLRGVDDRRDQVLAAAQLDDLARAHIHGFAACALPGVPASKLKSEAGLVASLEHLASRYGKRYGNLLDSCLPRLQAYERGLRDMQTPAASTQLDELRAAAAGMRQSWVQYDQYLLDPAQNYRRATAKPHFERAAAAWMRHRVAHRALSRVLRARVL